MSDVLNGLEPSVNSTIAVLRPADLSAASSLPARAADDEEAVVGDALAAGVPA